MLHLGRIVKVDELIRRCFQALPFHICIKFCGRVILIFIFIVKFWYLQRGVNRKPISHDDINNLGCTKFYVFPTILFFRFGCCGQIP
jgi:hypothetical protein